MHTKILKIFVYGFFRNKRENVHMRDINNAKLFPRIHRWRVVSLRGTWYRQNQRLAAGSLANKRNDVRTLLPGMICVSTYWLLA